MNIDNMKHMFSKGFGGVESDSGIIRTWANGTQAGGVVWPCSCAELYSIRSSSTI